MASDPFAHLVDAEARGTDEWSHDASDVSGPVSVGSMMDQMSQMHSRADTAETGALPVQPADCSSTEVPLKRIAELEAAVAEAERQRQLVVGERDGALSELQRCRVALAEAKQAGSVSVAASDKEKAKLETKVAKLEKSEKGLRQQLAAAAQSSAGSDELAGQLVALQIEVRRALAQRAGAQSRCKSCRCRRARPRQRTLKWRPTMLRWRSSSHGFGSSRPDRPRNAPA